MTAYSNIQMNIIPYRIRCLPPAIKKLYVSHDYFSFADSVRPYAYRSLDRFMNGFKVMINHLGCFAYGTHFSFFQKNRLGAKCLDGCHIMTDKYNRPPVTADLLHFAQTFFF